MSLLTRLGLPDGVHELPTAVPAGQLSGLWPGSAAAAAEAAALPPSATTPHVRLRRRALLRADPGLPDRPVLIEWFARADLDAAEAARRQGACHVHLLRLHHIGFADARTAYAISEAPAGVDLHTVCRAAPEKLPAWWAVAVVAAAARGLGALHQHLQRRGGTAHGGIELGTLFVSWSGAVQLLAYAPPVLPSLAPTAPEVLAAPRLITPAADVYALGAVLRALLPQAALARGPLQRLVRRCLLPHADERPALPAVQAALEAALWELDAPLGRAAAIGELLGRVCPRAATVDLADAEWGDSALASFATLPATLFPLNPLSTGAVPLSPTWVTAAPEPTVSPVPPPAPRSSRRTLAVGAAALGAALLGSGALWLAGTSSPAPGAPGSAQLAPSGSGLPVLAGSPPAPPGLSSAATAGSSPTAAPSLLGNLEPLTASSEVTAQLLPLLRRTAGSRVVVVASNAHRDGRIDLEDLNFERRGYKAWPAYCQSKLANLLFVLELQRRLKAAGADILVTAAHPGWTATDLQRSWWIVRMLNPYLAMKPVDGALPTLRAATDPDARPGEYFGPRYLMEMSGPPVRARLSRRAQDQETAARLWTTSEAMTGIRYDLLTPAAA